MGRHCLVQTTVRAYFGELGEFGEFGELGALP